MTYKRKIALGLVAISSFTTQASAAIVAPTFDSADAITIGTAVIGGLALIWAIKKAISLAR